VPVETRTLATKLPVDLAETLVAVCKRLGLQKSLFVEEAIREKIEDLLDAEDLRDAMKEATGFHAWEEVKAEARKEGRRSHTRSKSRAERDETT
jgi:predicted DNA-binding protein